MNLRVQIRAFDLKRLRHKHVRFLQRSRPVHNNRAVYVVSRHRRSRIFALGHVPVNVGAVDRESAVLSDERQGYFDFYEPKP